MPIILLSKILRLIICDGKMILSCNEYALRGRFDVFQDNTYVPQSILSRLIMQFYFIGGKGHVS